MLLFRDRLRTKAAETDHVVNEPWRAPRGAASVVTNVATRLTSSSMASRSSPNSGPLPPPMTAKPWHRARRGSRPGVEQAASSSDRLDTVDMQCAQANALEFPNAIVISPDGKHVYVASFYSLAVAIFDRNVATPNSIATLMPANHDEENDR